MLIKEIFADYIPINPKNSQYLFALKYFHTAEFL